MYIRLLGNLVLAHLLGDFPLQPDFVFRQKSKGWPGVALHAGAFFLMGALLVFPSLKRPSLIVFLFLLTVIHFLVDESKLRLFRRHEVDNLWVFLADQVLHFGSLLVGVWLYLAYLNKIHGGSRELGFSFSMNIVEVLTGLVISTYVGVILNHYVEKMFRPANYQNENLGVAQKYYGILGRLAVTSAFLVQPYLLVTLSAALVFLFLLTLRAKGWGKGLGVSFLSSSIIASLAGMFLWF